MAAHFRFQCNCACVNHVARSVQQYTISGDRIDKYQVSWDDNITPFRTPCDLVPQPLKQIQNMFDWVKGGEIETDVADIIQRMYPRDLHAMMDKLHNVVEIGCWTNETKAARMRKVIEETFVVVHNWEAPENVHCILCGDGMKVEWVCGGYQKFVADIHHRRCGFSRYVSVTEPSGVRDVHSYLDVSILMQVESIGCVRRTSCFYSVTQSP